MGRSSEPSGRDRYCFVAVKVPTLLLVGPLRLCVPTIVLPAKVPVQRQDVVPPDPPILKATTPDSDTDALSRIVNVG